MWANTQGAVLAGVAYIGLLNALGGVGGQAPVFYNLLIALEALAVLSSLARTARIESNAGERSVAPRIWQPA